jgi:hypothetical protein
MTAEDPTLTDSKAMGGVIAQGGFDYQLWDGLVRLPHWLQSAAFEGLVFEGLEDLEARFFAPHASELHFVDRFQAKSGNLAAADVRDIFESFRNFEDRFPGRARAQTLVTPRLPTTLSWLARDQARIEKARPFYAPFPDVMGATDERLLRDLVKEFGEVVGSFVFKSVEVAERPYPDRQHAVIAFSSAFANAFPSVDVAQPKIEATFEALSSLARKSIGSMLNRANLLQALESAVGRNLQADTAFPLRIRADDAKEDEASLEIDARNFCGPTQYPEPTVWSESLVRPLHETARWLRSAGRTRVRLSGVYRLSTAMTIGWTFRSATGFEIDIATRDGGWSTDDRPDEQAMRGTWKIDRPNRLHNGRLAVSVGILRDPGEDVEQLRREAILSALFPYPVTSAKQAQALVGTLKAAVAEATAELKPDVLDLYLAGPAAFAVALGHRWNGLPRTQLHEFLAAERRYVPTAMLS